MSFADRYLSKQKGFKPAIIPPPPQQLNYIVVIPVYCEPELVSVLESLWNCDRPNGFIEIILVVNSAENADKEIISTNNGSVRSAKKWISSHQDAGLQFHIIHRPDMPVKDAGVGLARKTGMDEAIYRFNLINKSHGFILSLDADSTCDINYFTEIENLVSTNPQINGFDIYFEHPVSGKEYNNAIYEGIVFYELHLRYVNQFLRLTGFPFAHHTIGSCFGVRADIYCAQGGMNKRKGGEDFYFLHKIIPLGNFTDIITTCITPSPRESKRVPFGTGPAISRLIASGTELTTYAPDCFMALLQYFTMIPGFFKADRENIQSSIDKLPVALKDFLKQAVIFDAVTEINDNSRTVDTFTNRFYRWFDAFRIVKFLNYASREYYPKTGVSGAARQLLQLLGYEGYKDAGTRELLTVFRRIERDNQ
jgi:cellulose synthase/poly-beta-1,6-N-acetylglucosamine synthase-like glycosyltransferase